MTFLQFTDYVIENVLLKLISLVKGKLQLSELRSLASDVFLAEKRETARRKYDDSHFFI